jgi:uncharacterized protein YndB with AHSA1/START domain
MTYQKITIEATVLANRQKTWDCYTQPEHMMNWNFAAEEWHCPNATIDLTVGGKFRARMEAKDGSAGFDFEGTYTEITEGETLSYIMADGRKVDITFRGSDEATQVTLIFDAETENPPELQQFGWQSILNNFKTYTETKA